ncbi:glutamate-1-semialdehyde 2,1-aminomutase [Verrucomicrobium sp. GAS474]|uniref:aminotransferase class III-fold pyridoxal phosphate-dependent enzyme n=1 Tax=Verrucomicrobium sp. GAS474 TaxID=1882831 RepID=UPI00087B5785|nr:aminotransferase class III-fold pyridoxal phosphate-dependent enzyme [Verrucomicrobium sp. GAS474]SDU23170.1 glutamate-1-semialdehyde 2,1-aminomutase [Verrucomicrobium sp. GAS474]
MGRDFSQSLALFERASRVIPGGIYGHTTPAAVLPGRSPYYAVRASGSRYWDVDGNEYIDYMCGYGPIVLGHGHPGVEEAAERQRREALCVNHPGPVMIELAEYLVDRVDFASWAVFGKNGSDMTTWAIQVAREQTKRKKILKIAGAYHGIAPWCTPGHAGVIEEDTAHIHTFPWNDLDAFTARLKEFRGEIAGVILTPFHHPAFSPSILPADGFLRGVEEACRREGIVIILDDIRAGFRLHHGGSHRYFGFEPDLICFCKAIANGHPLSAALGRKDLRIAASKVFLTGSYWNSPPPMAASLACLQLLEKENGVEIMKIRGQALMDGLTAAGAKHGYTILSSGPPAIPYPTFADDADFRRQQRFCAEVTARGAFFHPHHNWFLSTAHTEADIAETVRIAEEAFAVVREIEVSQK